MEASLKSRQPEHWQDFETLCKKLWGEIWNCPEIQKNGRLGQKQNGVDIYGIPIGEKMYFGIQCKGKVERGFELMPCWLLLLAFVSWFGSILSIVHWV